MADNSEQHFRFLENMYHRAPTNDYFKPVLEIVKSEATLTIPVREDFFHAGGAVHGAVYFKALDDAAFFAANSLVRDVFVLTVSFSIQLIRPVVAGQMVAKGRVTQPGRTQIFAQSDLYDARGRLVAQGQGNFSRSKTLLTPEIGYCD